MPPRAAIGCRRAIPAAALAPAALVGACAVAKSSDTLPAGPHLSAGGRTRIRRRVPRS